MRIEVTECLEIFGYVIGKEASRVLMAHYLKFGDWLRLKDMLICELVRKNREVIGLREKIKQLQSRKEVELL